MLLAVIEAWRKCCLPLSACSHGAQGQDLRTFGNAKFDACLSAAALFFANYQKVKRPVRGGHRQGFFCSHVTSRFARPLSCCLSSPHPAALAIPSAWNECPQMLPSSHPHIFLVSALISPPQRSLPGIPHLKWPPPPLSCLCFLSLIPLTVWVLLCTYLLIVYLPEWRLGLFLSLPVVTALPPVPRI